MTPKAMHLFAQPGPFLSVSLFRKVDEVHPAPPCVVQHDALDASQDSSGSSSGIVNIYMYVL